MALRPSKEPIGLLQGSHVGVTGSAEKQGPGVVQAHDGTNRPEITRQLLDPASQGVILRAVKQQRAELLDELDGTLEVVDLHGGVNRLGEQVMLLIPAAGWP